MSEEDKVEQTVVDKTDDSAKPESEDKGGAQDKSDDIEKALSEWDDADEGSSTEQKGKSADKGSDDADLRAEIKAIREEQHQRVYREDFGSLVKTIRGDFAGDEVSDKFIGVWVNSEAEEDPRLAIAWRDRHKDPAKFQRTVKALTKKFAQEHARFRKADEDATSTREAVAAAVRGRSNKAPDGKAPDFSKDSDGEYRANVEKQYGYTPRV